MNQNVFDPKKLIMEEIIYILTNDEDASRNIFKIGKTTEKNLKNRLSQYNTGSSRENYFIFIEKVYNARLIEKYCSFCMETFKLKVGDKINDEMYRIDINNLLKILKIIIDQQKYICNLVNNEIENILRKSILPAEIKMNKLNINEVRLWLQENLQISRNFDTDQIEFKDLFESCKKYVGTNEKHFLKELKKFAVKNSLKISKNTIYGVIEIL